jgi:hypothetical protein
LTEFMGRSTKLRVFLLLTDFAFIGFSFLKLFLYQKIYTSYKVTELQYHKSGLLSHHLA